MGDLNSRHFYRARKTTITAADSAASADFLSGSTGDTAKVFFPFRHYVRRVQAALRGSAAPVNAVVISVYRLATLNQVVTNGTLLDQINIPAASTTGNIYYVDLSPSSGNIEAGQELAFYTTSGGLATDYFICHAEAEPRMAVDADAPGGRMNEST